MKKIAYILLSLCLAFTAIPMLTFAETGNTNTNSADILYAAVDGVPITNGKVFSGNGGNIQLTGDSVIRNRELGINDGNNWVLDLNGYNLILAGDFNISKKSTLTIIDTSEAGSGRLTFENGGIVINGSSGEGIIGTFRDGDISYENEQHVYSTLVVKGGTVSANTSPTIKVLGNGATLKIEGGNVYNSATSAIVSSQKKENGGVDISVTSGSVISTLGPAMKLMGYGNYYIGGSETTITGSAGIEIASGNLTIIDNPKINGSGESAVIRSDSTGSALSLIVENANNYYGKLNVHIEGGTFTSDNAYAFDEYLSESSGSTLAEIDNVNVEGGYFKGGEGAVRTDILKNFIAGGNFSSSPAKWIKGGYTISAASDSDYKYSVIKSEANINGAVSEVTASVYPVYSSDVAVQSVADTIRANIGDLIGLDTLRALSWSMFNDNTIFNTDLIKQAKSELSDLGKTGGGTYSSSNPLFVISPYFEINVVSANTTTGRIEIKIEAKYDLFATTADDAASMVKTGEGKNAVKLLTYETMKFNDPVEISIPLPNEFTRILGSSFYVKHTSDGGKKSYVYKGAIKNYAVQFDVYRGEAGLGTFVINSDGPAAYISDAPYYFMSIQECVDTLEDGDTLNLYQSGDAVFSKSITFRVNDNGNKFNYKGGNGYEVTVGEDGLYRVNEIKTYFTDIKKEEYYYNAVVWAVDNGIAMGISDTIFVPDGDCTRSQVVTFLWRAAGSPVITDYTNPFADVSADDYFYDAVLWAVKNGITTGINDNSFAPSNIVTRSQFVTFLARYASNIDCEDESDINDDNPFTDLEEDSYYLDSVKWAYQRGITTGASEDKFNPLGTCTRGQTVTFIYRYFYQN